MCLHCKNKPIKTGQNVKFTRTGQTFLFLGYIDKGLMCLVADSAGNKIELISSEVVKV